MVNSVTKGLINAAPVALALWALAFILFGLPGLGAAVMMAAMVILQILGNVS